MSNNVNLISWNVKGLNNHVKRNGVLTHLQHLKVGIAYLQEPHLRDINCSLLRRGWVGQIFHLFFQARARGAAILIEKNIPFEPSSVVKDRNGRYIIVSGKLFNRNVVLANVYAPNSDDAAFLEISFFLDTNAYSEVSSLILWDTLKAYLRGQIISFIANKNSTLNKKRLDILNQIHNIDYQYAKTPKPELYNGLGFRLNLISTQHTRLRPCCLELRVTTMSTVTSRESFWHISLEA